jgi:outer membrane protein TolC
LRFIAQSESATIARTEGEIGMRRNSAVRLALVGLCLTGCHRPYFMTEVDYAYYNRISGDYATRERFDDIDAIAQHRPPNVTDFGKRQEWQLCLQDAKHIALAANKRIAVLGFTPGESGTRIDTALSSFDAQIGFGGAWSRTERQISNLAQGGGLNTDAFVQNAFGPTFQGTGTTLTTGGATDGNAIPALDVFGLAKRNATGGITRFSYNLDYQRSNPAGFSQVNPSWNGTATVAIEQPLLQGAGVEFNRAPILIARAGMEQSVKDFDAQVRTVLRDVENAYWQLYFSYQEVYSRKVGLELGLVLWQRAVDKLDAGSGNRSEVAQAREQFEFFKGQLIDAENQLLSAEQDLRRLMGVAPFDEYRIIPSDTPNEAQYTPDMFAAIQEAMQLRPELASQRFKIRASEIELMRQKNGLLPDLSVTAAYGLSGLDNQFDQQFNRLFSNKYTEWRLGVRYTRQIGERAANAATRNAQLALSRERFRLRELEDLTIGELGTAYREVFRSFNKIDVQRQRRRAAAEQLESRKANYELGKDTLDVLVRAQSVYADALRDEAQAVVQYNQSLVAWEFAKGTILINDNVTLAEEICSNVPEAVRAKVYQELTCARPLPIHPGTKVVPDTTSCPDTSLPIYKVQPSQIPLPLAGAGVNLKDQPLPPPTANPESTTPAKEPTLPANPPVGTPPSGTPPGGTPKAEGQALPMPESEAPAPPSQKPVFQNMAPTKEPKLDAKIERTAARRQFKGLASPPQFRIQNTPTTVLPSESQLSTADGQDSAADDGGNGWKRSPNNP